MVSTKGFKVEGMVTNTLLFIPLEFSLPFQPNAHPGRDCSSVIHNLNAGLDDGMAALKT